MDRRKFGFRTLGAVLGALGLVSAKAAVTEVAAEPAPCTTQACCGNMICASDPGVCKPGCVCCVYSNGNSRCLAPGLCRGEIVTP